MKKYMKSMALLSLATVGITQAQESEMGVGIEHGNLDSINSINHSPNAPDLMTEKGFGSGSYRVFLAASGASSTYSVTDYAYAGGGCMRVDGNGGIDGDFDLNFQLPDGHQILGYRFYWYDASASNSNAYLFKFDGAGGLTLLGNNASTGDTGYGEAYLDLSADNLIVSNFDGAYTIRFTSGEDGNDQRVCAVRLFVDADPA